MNARPGSRLAACPRRPMRLVPDGASALPFRPARWATDAAGAASGCPFAGVGTMTWNVPRRATNVRAAPLLPAPLYPEIEPRGQGGDAARSRWSARLFRGDLIERLQRDGAPLARSGTSRSLMSRMRRGPIFTVGHSNRSFLEFLELLQALGVRLVADVRRFPHSRRHPQFNRDRLSSALAAHGITYWHCPALGGRRPPRPDSPNTAWSDPGFRGFADHMQTAEFAAALDELLARG